MDLILRIHKAYDATELKPGIDFIETITKNVFGKVYTREQRAYVKSVIFLKQYSGVCKLVKLSLDSTKLNIDYQ